MIQADLVKPALQRPVNIIAHLFQRLPRQREQKISRRRQSQLMRITHNPLRRLLVAKRLPPHAFDLAAVKRLDAHADALVPHRQLRQNFQVGMKPRRKQRRDSSSDTGQRCFKMGGQRVKQLPDLGR